MANEFGNINPWMGALQGALGSLRYAGSQPYSQAGFGNAFGGGMDQGMGFYQSAMQMQLLKRRVAEQEREKMVWEGVADALQGGKPEDVGKALLSGRTPETTKLGIQWMMGQQGREEAERVRLEDQQFRLKLVDKEGKWRERIAKLGNPLAGLGDGGWNEPTFPTAPGATPAPAPAAPAPSAPRATAAAPAGPMGPPDPRPLRERYPTETPPDSLRLIRTLEEMRKRSRERYQDYMSPR